MTVTLDAAAVAAVGGRPALAAQLKDADLVAAGWAVAGPNAGPGSTTVISASHPFDTTAQAAALVGELAGTGPDSSRPFRLSISEHHSFWRTDTTLTGKVDLSCGLACFGDSGLSTSLGSPVGVNAGPLASEAHQSPDQVFTFSVAARLGGKVLDTNGVADKDGTLHWTPRLGQSLQMAARHPFVERRPHQAVRDRRRGARGPFLRPPRCGSLPLAPAAPAQADPREGWRWARRQSLPRRAAP